MVTKQYNGSTHWPAREYGLLWDFTVGLSYGDTSVAGIGGFVCKSGEGDLLALAKTEVAAQEVTLVAAPPKVRLNHVRAQCPMSRNGRSAPRKKTTPV